MEGSGCSLAETGLSCTEMIDIDAGLMRRELREEHTASLVTMVFWLRYSGHAVPREKLLRDYVKLAKTTAG